MLIIRRWCIFEWIKLNSHNDFVQMAIEEWIQERERERVKRERNNNRLKWDDFLISGHNYCLSIIWFKYKSKLKTTNDQYWIRISSYWRMLKTNECVIIFKFLFNFFPLQNQRFSCFFLLLFIIDRKIWISKDIDDLCLRFLCHTIVKW